MMAEVVVEASCSSEAASGRDSDRTVFLNTCQNNA